MLKIFVDSKNHVVFRHLLIVDEYRQMQIKNIFLIRHRQLLFELVKRDVLTRYRGAMFGIFWVLLSPLIMLAIFAFVFGNIFQSRWPNQPDDIPFWLVLYSGLIVFNLFSESVSRSPSAVREYPSYVKKIIFPVSILPLVPLGSAIAHTLFNLLIFCLALTWFGKLTSNLFLLPILILPALLLAAGLAYFFAAWGVFIKDVAQVAPLIMQMLLFLSPVFYPISVVPEFLQPIYQLNPLGVVIESIRSAIFDGVYFELAWFLSLLVGLVAAYAGYRSFENQRDEFANVL